MPLRVKSRQLGLAVLADFAVLERRADALLEQLLTRLLLRSLLLRRDEADDRVVDDRLLLPEFQSARLEAHGRLDDLVLAAVLLLVRGRDRVLDRLEHFVLGKPLLLGDLLQGLSDVFDIKHVFRS